MAPERDEGLVRQYDRAVEEYRFQVDLNWRRSEYFFVLNVGVLIASATMFSSGDVPRELVAVLFFVGALLAGLSFLANDVQHGYYKSARNRKTDLEKRLELGDLALATTPGMGSGLRRLGRVGTFLKIMLVAIALADLVGAGFAIDKAIGASTSKPARTSLVINLEPSSPREDFSAVVVSQGRKTITSRRFPQNETSLMVSLLPGQYRIFIAGTSLCHKDLRVGDDPLQLATIRC